ncbi:MAG: hypothetical protein H7143_05970, partial [Pseudorhodobacter sp.]|nr:hypothetical protein [Rhizobacter sp.]
MNRLRQPFVASFLRCRAGPVFAGLIPALYFVQAHAQANSQTAAAAA